MAAIIYAQPGKPATILSSVTSTKTGTVINLMQAAENRGGNTTSTLPQPVGLLIATEDGGAWVGTVTLYGTISTDAEVAADTARWGAIDGGAFTANVATGIFAPFTHVRADCTAYTSGSPMVRVLV